MRYIVEEILIPWLPSGASTTSFIAEDYEQMRTIVQKLLDEAMRVYHFSMDDIEEPFMWEDGNEEGYLEAYLNKEASYSNWSVCWRPETEFNL